MKLTVPMEVLLYAEHEQRIIARDMLRRAERRRIEVARHLKPPALHGGGHGFEVRTSEAHGR